MGQTHCNSKLLAEKTTGAMLSCFWLLQGGTGVHCLRFAHVAVCFVIFLRPFRTWRTPLGALKRSGSSPPCVLYKAWGPRWW